MQKAILKKWATWRKENLKYLRAYQPLLEERPPLPVETMGDDVYMRQLTRQWKPDEIDGFAHLRPEGGWVFLFNPTDSRKMARLTLRLKDYGIEEFSAMTEVEGLEYDRINHTLTFHHSLGPGSFLQSRVYAGYPMRLEKLDNRIVEWEWDVSKKELRMVCAAGDGECRAQLATGGMGQPSHMGNGRVISYDRSADRLVIAYCLPRGMVDGSVLQTIRLRWE